VGAAGVAIVAGCADRGVLVTVGAAAGASDASCVGSTVVVALGADRSITGVFAGAASPLA
jgi:hypothetical protein